MECTKNLQYIVFLFSLSHFKNLNQSTPLFKEQHTTLKYRFILTVL